MKTCPSCLRYKYKEDKDHCCHCGYSKSMETPAAAFNLYFRDSRIALAKIRMAGRSGNKESSK